MKNHSPALMVSAVRKLLVFNAGTPNVGASLFFARAVCLCSAFFCSVMLSTSAVAELADKPWLDERMSLADARHLAGRTGFGSSPHELSSLTGLTRQQGVDAIVAGLRSEPYIAMPPWVNAPAPRFWTRRLLDTEGRQIFDDARDKEIEELRLWWVNTMLQTDSPQTERLVLFWHDHFATGYDGIGRRSAAMARQNAMFRSMGTGSYRDLLKAIIRDPAMLVYLDNQANNKRKPNENLARELLELFTLGEGNYTEKTVKEAARALTGYGFSDTANQSFRLHGYKRDMGQKTLFGVTANHDGDSLIDLILEQPESAEHLARKFWYAYVSDNTPDTRFIDSIASGFRDSDYDLGVLYRSVLESESFWHDENRLSLIKSPVNLLVGTARSLEYPKKAWQQIPALQSLLGMNLFSPPNVAGWDEGASFVAPGKLLNRQLALDTLLGTADSAVQSLPQSNMQAGVMQSESMQNTMLSMRAESMNEVGAKVNSDSTTHLISRIAGHHFKGAPRYQVSVLDKNSKTIWTSKQHVLAIGYDTEKFGEMRNTDLLSWYNDVQLLPSDVAENARFIQVEFLNDAADKTGDRNLFVDTVSLGGKTYSSAGAKQASACVPKNKRYAGALYCAGTVDIAVNRKKANQPVRASAYTATDASALWTRKKGKKLDAIFALENVQTPNGFYHTVSFHIMSQGPTHFQLTVDSFGCWPDCIQDWPECAWQNQQSRHELSVVLPLRRGRDAGLDCHYDSLDEQDKALLDTLWKSVPTIIDVVSAREADSRHSKKLQQWKERLNTLSGKLNASAYSKRGSELVFNSRYEVEHVANTWLPTPMTDYMSLGNLNEALREADVTLADLLLGGVDKSAFPEFNNLGALTAQQQLDLLVEHPVYQVY